MPLTVHTPQAPHLFYLTTVISQIEEIKPILEFSKHFEEKKNQIFSVLTGVE
jgi:hypothetical protein